MKWALFVFAFVAPLIVNGIFFIFETFKKKEELSFKNKTVQKELWNLGASFVLCLISAIVGLFSSDVSAMNIFVGNLFICFLAREMTPLIKLDWKKLDKKAITPIAKAAIALLGFIFEISLFQTWSIYLLSGMRLGAFALLAYLVGNLTESYYENKDLSIIRVAFGSGTITFIAMGSWDGVIHVPFFSKWPVRVMSLAAGALLLMGYLKAFFNWNTARKNAKAEEGRA